MRLKQARELARVATHRALQRDGYEFPAAIGKLVGVDSTLDEDRWVFELRGARDAPEGSILLARTRVGASPDDVTVEVFHDMLRALGVPREGHDDRLTTARPSAGGELRLSRLPPPSDPAMTSAKGRDWVPRVKRLSVDEAMEVARLATRGALRRYGYRFPDEVWKLVGVEIRLGDDEEYHLVELRIAQDRPEDSILLTRARVGPMGADDVTVEVFHDTLRGLGVQCLSHGGIVDPPPQ